MFLSSDPNNSNTSPASLPAIAKPNIDGVIYGRLPSFESSITAPFDYLHSIPSNNHNIRVALLHAFNEVFFLVKDDRVLAVIGDLVGTLHEASLLIDDIEDESDMRRGRPAAHTQFGLALTINSGNYMYFLACQKAANMLPRLAISHHTRDCETHSGKYSSGGHSSSDCPGGSVEVGGSGDFGDSDDSNKAFLSIKARVFTIIMDEMLRLHMGQGQDLHWRTNLSSLCNAGVPRTDEYLKMAMDKTGGLLRLSVSLLVIFLENSSHPPANSEATALANLIGIVYQIRDDYLNLVDPRYAKMKGFAGEDLVEGKLSLPVLYALSCSTDSPVHHLLLRLRSSKERLSQPEMLQQALTYIQTCGALLYCYDLLQEYARKGQKMVAGTGSPNAHKLAKILVDLANVLVPDQDTELVSV